MVRRKHIRTLVQRLLTEHHVRSAPVEVADIAKALGLEVQETPAEDDLSGFLYRDRKRNSAIIGVNAEHHPNRRNFTAAHELGMLQYLVHWSIHNRVVVTALAILLLVVGIYAAGNGKLDVFPEFAPPEVIIQTEAPGLSPEEVEQQVTTPIEAEVNGLPGLATLRSKSIQGLSVVTVIFQDGTDIYRARQLVGEKIAELAGQLPAGVKPPRMAPLTPTTGRLLTVGLTSEKLSPMELRDLAQWTLRPP